MSLRLLGCSRSFPSRSRSLGPSPSCSRTATRFRPVPVSFLASRPFPGPLVPLPWLSRSFPVPLVTHFCAGPKSLHLAWSLRRLYPFSHALIRAPRLPGPQLFGLGVALSLSLQSLHITLPKHETASVEGRRSCDYLHDACW